ncbi:TDP-N-acetylfucosamine:lipid II N-acetylfucosaminyltransferase [Dokdonia sinensis]|nr:TDP-N-acetylfucosamine:lipid II N-acetylfucosaminyltransferase [Dokdonia sinensis]
MNTILFVSSIDKDALLGELISRLSINGGQYYRYYVLSGELKMYENGNCKVVIKGSKSSASRPKAILRARKLIPLLKEVQIVHYHFIDTLVPLIDFFIIRKKPLFKIATVWGSDFYKASGIKARIKSILYRNVQTITFTNDNTRKVFLEHHVNLSVNFRTVRFGLSILSNIDSQLNDYNSSKNRKNWNYREEDVVIAIGTNASPNQNHLKILSALNSLPENAKSNWRFIIPLGYPNVSQTYLNEIKEQIKASHLENCRLDFDYYKGEQLASYRLLPDVLIQLQTTDQFSGAMQETLFAKRQIITGSWLPYNLLVQKGISFSLCNTFSELPEILLNIIQKPISESDRIKNKKIIRELSHWDEVFLSWNKLYTID